MKAMFFCLHVLLTHTHIVSASGILWLLHLQAIVLAPNKALPHVAACISMGRLAVFSDNKTKVSGAAQQHYRLPSRLAATAVPLSCPCA